MEKRVMVLSLGGSLIIPDDIDISFLTKFKKVLLKNTHKYRFVVVCGGGSIARKYISALRKSNVNEKIQSMAGIGATRMNARFLTYFFGKDASSGIPHDMKEVKNLIEKNDIVFCGALRYEEKETSDATSAKLAHFFKTDFINLTNVPGLFTDNPLTNKNAKFISRTSWKNLYKRANKLKYKAGQHFVIDQEASRMIMQNRTKTYIIGKNLKNLDNILHGKKFKGTLVYG